MSFSVDLWNGFDAIKSQIFSAQRKLKSIVKIISSYQTIEATYNKSLENLYKEFKEINNSEYMIDQSYTKLIEMFQYEHQNRKSTSLYNNIILEPLNEYLRQPNIILNKSFSDNLSNEESFKRTLNILKEKQSNYYKECKELSVLLAQNEMDEINGINSGKLAKNKTARVNEKFKRLNNSKKEYIDYISEANKEREKYNQRTEDILNNLEQIYKTMLEHLTNSLTNFTMQRNEFLRKMYLKEKGEYENIHSKIDVKQEIYNFVANNATKEFPMIKFEFCPLKYPVLNQNVKSKCPKFPESSFPKIYKSIKEYFEENKIFKEEIPYRLNRRNTDFLSNLFMKKTTKDIIMGQEKDEMKEDKEFIEKYITDLFMNKTQEKKEENNKKELNINKSENKEKNVINEESQTNKDKNKEINKDNKKEDNLEKKEEQNIQTKPEEDKQKEIINDKTNNNPESANTQESKEKEKNETPNIPEPNKKENEDEEDKKMYIHNYFDKDNPNYINNIETLIKKLSYLRSKGYFQIQEHVYNKILSLFFIILNQETKDYYTLKNLLILSQTFYKIKDNKKEYLQEGLKNFKLLMNPETWHRVINYSMNLSCSSMDLSQSTEDKINKINKEAGVIVMAYLCDIKQYCDDEKVFNEVKNYYVKVYNMDEEMINKEVDNYMNSLYKNETTLKERHIKLEEKIKKENEAELYNDEDNLISDNKAIKQRSFSTYVNYKSNKNLTKNKDIEKEIIKEQDQEQEQEQEDENSNKDNMEKEKELPENKNQIINNNINIIKIEAKEVIIMDNSKEKINIEQIKMINTDKDKDKVETKNKNDDK